MACDPQSVRLKVVIGDTAKLKFTITKADCETPQPLEDFPEIYFTIKRSNMDPDAAAIWRGSLTDGDIEILTPPGADGIVEVTVPPSASALLRNGRLYPWDIELVGDSDNVYTPLSGDILPQAQTSKIGG